MPGVKAGAKGTAASHGGSKDAFDIKKVAADRLKPGAPRTGRITVNESLQAVCKMTVVEIVYWAGACDTGFGLAKYGHDLSAAFDYALTRFRDHMIAAAEFLSKEELAKRFKDVLSANNIKLSEKDRRELDRWLKSDNDENPNFDQSNLRSLLINIRGLIRTSADSPLYQDWKHRVVTEYLHRAAIGYRQGTPYQE